MWSGVENYEENELCEIFAEHNCVLWMHNFLKQAFEFEMFEMLRKTCTREE